MRLADSGWNAVEENQALSAWLNEVEIIAKESEKKGIRVAVFAPIPVFKGNPKGWMNPGHICTKEWFRPKISPNCYGLFRERRITLESRLDNINKGLNGLSAVYNNIKIYKPFDALCPKRLVFCETYIRSVRTFRDDDHLSRDGSLMVASDFLDFARREGLITR